MMRRFVPTLVFVSLFVLPVAAQTVKVVGTQSIQRKSGEAQSTVVPPGVNPACTAGRVLVTIDTARPPASGVVVGRDLDKLAGADIVATFDHPGGSAAKAVNYDLSATDHDLVALPNGHVLYLHGSWLRHFTNKLWAKDTFRGTFGPGARSGVTTWRSTDCGKTFQWIGDFDPVAHEDGSCANPQFRDGSTEAPWDMGGSDGQLVTADPKSGRLYLTFQCVGFNGQRGPGPFKLDPNSPLNKTLFAESADEGKSWKSLGFMQGYPAWRFGVIPFSTSRFAFAYSEGITRGMRRPGASKLSFDAQYDRAPVGTWGFENFPKVGALENPNLKAYMWSHSVIGRVPGSPNGVFMAFPDTIPGKGHGLQFAFWDMTTRTWGAPEAAIVPMKASMENFIFHPVVIDSGKAPPLLYWYDIDAAAKQATIRGRFITSYGTHTADFTIAQFAMNQQGPPGYWYGDYHTAGGGYLRPGALATGTTAYSYFPIWVQPDNSVHFARVDFTETLNPGNVVITTIPSARLQMTGTKLEPTKVRVPARVREDLKKHRRGQP